MYMYIHVYTATFLDSHCWNSHPHPLVAGPLLPLLLAPTTTTTPTNVTVQYLYNIIICSRIHSEHACTVYTCTFTLYMHYMQHAVR